MEKHRFDALGDVDHGGGVVGGVVLRILGVRTGDNTPLCPPDGNGKQLIAQGSNSAPATQMSANMAHKRSTPFVSGGRGIPISQSIPRS